MAIITVNTPFNIDLEFKVAEFPKRLLAWIVDIVIITLYYYLMLTFVSPLISEGTGFSTFAEMFLIVLPVILYQLSFEMFMNGQTLGKKLTGIKIIDVEGREPSWGQFLTRWALCPGNYFLYALPKYILISPFVMLIFGIIYLPDALFMLISNKGQRIGDLAAGTTVIDANYKPNIDETIYKAIDVAVYKPSFPQVMRLTDRDINGIRNLLNIKNPGKDTEKYVHQVVAKIKAVLQIDSPIEGYDFLQQLLFDYNFITGNGVQV